MKRQSIFISSIAISIVVFTFVGLWAIKKISEKTLPDKKFSQTESKVSSYWSCPMHPQVHLDHAGECPICHMKLVQVKSQEVQTSEANRTQIQMTSHQFDLIGVQKSQVEKMDLHISIPVSGRLISATSVAFQVYESDLHVIKIGLTFKGQSVDGEISGIITAIDTIVDPTSRTLRVLGRINKGPRGLIAETTFSGFVEIKLKDRVSIPESAVLHTGTGDLVYVFNEKNHLTARQVRLGPKSEGFYEVESGLDSGEFISSGPNFLIDSEAKIRGTSSNTSNDSKISKPFCPAGQHWDIPMAMCMPGKE